jgi:hypothetical protein
MDQTSIFLEALKKPSPRRARPASSSMTVAVITSSPAWRVVAEIPLNVSALFTSRTNEEKPK